MGWFVGTTLQTSSCVHAHTVEICYKRLKVGADMLATLIGNVEQVEHVHQACA
jgi:hypothetical protein